MEIHSTHSCTSLKPTPERVAELDRLGNAIAELSAHLEAATARLLDLIREFDARGGWGNGFRSCAHWLSWRIGLDLGAARRRSAWPAPSERCRSWRSPRPRGTVLRQSPGSDPRRHPADRSAAARVGRAGAASHVERIVRGWRCVDRKAEAREAKRQHASRALHVHQDDDGTVVLGGRLDPEVGALLVRALAAAREKLYQRSRGEAAPRLADPIADRPTMAQQQADALALLAEAALRHELDPGAPGERYQVVVHVDATALADPDQPGQSVLEDGQRVSAETSRRLACDASRVVMRHDEDGRTVEVGARTRTSPGIAARAAPPGPGLPLPGLWTPVRPGTSRPSLGSGRSNHAFEPRHALSPAPPRGPRRRVSGRSTARRRLRFRRPDGRCYSTSRPRPRCPPIRSKPSTRSTPRRGSGSTRGRPARPGWASVLIWATRSTSCIRWPTDSRNVTPRVTTAVWGRARPADH